MASTATPDSVTLRKLSGVFLMNKKQSGDFDSVLALQGVGWLTRKAIGLAAVTLYVKQYDDADGFNHIDIEQVATGGIKGTTEKRTIDGKPGPEHEDHIFGKVKGSNTWIKWADLKDDDEDDAYLKKGWTDDTIEAGETILGIADSVGNGWTSRQTWGFQIIDGERKYTRHVVVKKGSKTIRIITTYDYKGELPEEYKNRDF